MAKISTFEDLGVWQKAMDLCEKVYKSVDNSKMDFPLKDQLRKTAVSVASNIAEGFERESNNQFIYFLLISKASCGELRTQITIANRVKYIDNKNFEVLKNDCLDLSKQLSNFIKYLKQHKTKK